MKITPLKTSLALSGLAFCLAAPGTMAKPVSCTVALDQDVIPAGAPQKAVVKVSLDAAQAPTKEANRPPVNLCLVIDRSGSMQHQGKLEKAKEAAINALRRLSPKDRFSLIAYGNDVKTLIPSQSASNLKAIENKIRSIRSGGGTALFGGVSQGAAEVRKQLDAGFVNRLILLSDGLANEGPSSPADLGRLGASLMKEGISVSTIGLGNDYNEDLMTQLAERSDGSTWFVETVNDLAGIFDTELGDVLNVVANSVTIEIECAENVKPVRVIGRDGRIAGNKIEIQMNQLYGGQAKYVLVEVEVPAGENKVRRKVATARCHYAAAGTGAKHLSEPDPAFCSYSEDQQQIKDNMNIAVQADVNFNDIAIAQDQAIELYEQGQKEEAYKVLKQQAEQKATWGAANGRDDLVQEAQDLDLEAEKLRQEGLSKSQRKSFRENSYGWRVENRKK